MSLSSLTPAKQTLTDYRHAGYFSDGKVLTMADLEAVQGRAWEDVDH